LWEEHARGQIYPLTNRPLGRHSLDAIAASIPENKQVIAEQTVNEPFTEFGPRWNNLQRATLTPDRGLAFLELPEPFVSDLQSYRLHPALLDMATGFLCLSNRLEGSLPFSYKKLTILGALPAKLYSFARYSANQQSGALRFDVTITDEDGTELIDIEEYTIRPRAREGSGARPDSTMMLPQGENFRVEISSPGSLHTLRFLPASRRSPGPGEVEIEVAAAGLNFIEVLYALGMLPKPVDFEVRFGLECSGRVASVGEGVRNFHPGEEVIAFAPGCFGLFTTTPAACVAYKPVHLTSEEAATIPAAFVTAYYALIHTGRLRRGERVLIHAAAGGVGLAAVNIAQWVGAEIYATAGTHDKREYLRSQGIQHVFDSRSLDFAHHVMQRTGGRGVNVLLNSLGGEFISSGLSTLAPYGRFLEIGKRDIFNNTQIGLGLFERHLSFFAIDVGPEMPDFGTVWRDVTERCNAGDFRPLPFRTFPVAKVGDAFEHMAQARHIGKVVISMADIGAKSGLNPPMVDHQRSDAHISSRPETEIEASIVAIWQELLGAPQIGIHDDFFDLHGDSLLAAQVVSRLNKAFQTKLPLSSLFDSPTVASLANRVHESLSFARKLQVPPRLGGSDEEEEGVVL
jgi:NADPH:quinone reductase-like Zn-dependent oxidoreductase/acyl carrier protein